MNAVFKLIFFSIMVNLAIGLLMTLVPTFNGYNNYAEQYGNSYLGGLTYNDSYMDNFHNVSQKTLDPTFGVQTSSSIFDRILDKIGLGFVSTFLRIIDKYMFGIVNIMKMFTSGMFADAPGMSDFLFGGGIVPLGLFKGIMTIGYVLGAIWLLTGKKVITD